jgi:hypothetical protein
MQASDARDAAGSPPIDPGELMAEPPKWPKAVGITSIIVGSFWLLCGGCGIAYFAMIPWFAQMGEQQMGGPMPAVMYPHVVQYIIMAAGMLLDVLLIFAGVFTLSRNPTGRTLHLAYGAIATLTTLAGAIVGVWQALRIDAYFKQNPGDPWGTQNNTMLTFIMVVCFTLVGLAWPLFCLVWFGAVKRTPESMSGGGAGTPALGSI